MIDEPTSFTVKTGPVCPWCSEPLVGADAEHCPACGATMLAEQEPVIPGVTTIEPDILARQARASKPKRGGIMSLFVSGDDETPNIQQPTQAELPALAQPSLEVRREMLRIELEAAGVVPAEAAAAAAIDTAPDHEPGTAPEGAAVSVPPASAPPSQPQPDAASR